MIGASREEFLLKLKHSRFAKKHSNCSIKYCIEQNENTKINYV